MADVEFLLYVLPLNPACLKALKYAAAINCRIHECDVNLLKSKPSWLTGVPTLLDRKTKTIYRGTHCLRELQNMCLYNPVRLKPIPEHAPPRTEDRIRIPAWGLLVQSGPVLKMNGIIKPTRKQRDVPAITIEEIP